MSENDTNLHLGIVGDEINNSEDELILNFFQKVLQGALGISLVQSEFSLIDLAYKEEEEEREIEFLKKDQDLWDFLTNPDNSGLEESYMDPIKQVLSPKSLVKRYAEDCI